MKKELWKIALFWLGMNFIFRIISDVVFHAEITAFDASWLTVATLVFAFSE